MNKKCIGYIILGILLGMVLWAILPIIGLMALGAFIYKLYENSKVQK